MTARECFLQIYKQIRSRPNTRVGVVDRTVRRQRGKYTGPNVGDQVWYSVDEQIRSRGPQLIRGRIVAQAIGSQVLQQLRRLS